MQFTIEVKHYGPASVPDPDHSTFVLIRRQPEPGELLVRSPVRLELYNDEELDALIETLQDAKKVGDGDGVLPEQPVSEPVPSE